MPADRPKSNAIPLLAVGFAFGFFVGFAGSFGAALTNLFGPKGTIISVSPDERTRVELNESSGFLDRNFSVAVVACASDETLLSIKSGDHDRPIGTERVVWSADSCWALVVGKKFLGLPKDIELAEGYQPYMLIDVRQGKAWCNDGIVDLPRFGLNELRGISWEAVIVPDVP